MPERRSRPVLPSVTAATAGQVAAAKSVCRRCPVRQPCLDFALARGEKDGIWRGMSGAERQELSRDGRPPSAARS